MYASPDLFHVVSLATRCVAEERRLRQEEQRLQKRAVQLPAGPLPAGSERLRSTIRAVEFQAGAYPTWTSVCKPQKNNLGPFIWRAPRQSRTCCSRNLDSC